MKLLRHGPWGAERPGMLAADGTIRDLTGHVSDIAGDVLIDAGFAALAAIDPAGLPIVPNGTRLGPPVGQVGKFICVGLNYTDHARETGATPPEEPILFMKATSALCGPDDALFLPPGSEKMDWEVELGVVIGTSARHVSEAQAMDHVAGFCLIHDVSERTYQMEHGGQWTKGKSYDRFGPMGPYLVTRDELSDPHALRMTLAVNGETMQDGTTANMIFRVPALVAYISRFMTLLPGDVISTGTPAGVGLGMKPPRFLKIGDRVELAIDGLGRQHQTVRADPASA